MPHTWYPNGMSRGKKNCNDGTAAELSTINRGDPDGKEMPATSIKSLVEALGLASPVKPPEIPDLKQELNLPGQGQSQTCPG